MRPPQGSVAGCWQIHLVPPMRLCCAPRTRGGMSPATLARKPQRPSVGPGHGLEKAQGLRDTNGWATRAPQSKGCQNAKWGVEHPWSGAVWGGLESPPCLSSDAPATSHGHHHPCHLNRERGATGHPIFPQPKSPPCVPSDQGCPGRPLLSCGQAASPATWTYLQRQRVGRAGGEAARHRAEAGVGQDLLGGVVEDLRRSGPAKGQLGHRDLPRERRCVSRGPPRYPPGSPPSNRSGGGVSSPKSTSERRRVLGSTSPEPELNAWKLGVFPPVCCLFVPRICQDATSGSELFGALFEKARKPRSSSPGAGGLRSGCLGNRAATSELHSDPAASWDPSQGQT